MLRSKGWRRAHWAEPLQDQLPTGIQGLLQHWQAWTGYKVFIPLSLAMILPVLTVTQFPTSLGPGTKVEMAAYRAWEL